MNSIDIQNVCSVTTSDAAAKKHLKAVDKYYDKDKTVKFFLIKAQNSLCSDNHQKTGVY